MLAAMRDLMEVLARAIVTDEAAADLLMKVAAEAEDAGGAATAVRAVARLHRVKVIQNRARLDALTHEYVRRFDVDAVGDGWE